MSQNVRRSIIIFIIFVFVVTILLFLRLQSVENESDISAESNVTSKNTVKNTVGLSEGNIPPDFQLTDLNGNTMMLSDLKGKKVLLNFWAIWCLPCKEEMPHLEEIYKLYGEDLVIAAVSSAEPKQVVTEFLKYNPYSFPIYLDEKANISKTYQLLSIPTSYFINEEGVIQNKHIGLMNFKIIENYYKSL